MSAYLVVGASSGIGRQLSVQLSESGHQVFGTYNTHKVESKQIDYHYLDVLDEELNLDFLPDTLDGLVYCPGSINLKPFHRIKPEEFAADMQLQVIGAVKVMQAVFAKFKNSKNASIVLFSTVAVQLGLSFHTQVASSKGAIEGLTKALAAEFAPKIRINCIAPSLTDTPLATSLLNSEEKRESNAQRHPLKKIGKAKDIADMAEFLLSEKAGWITGQIFHIDGGMSAIKT